ncbi:aspartate aminotransferase family protein [Balneola sp. MJW-20]|uniref:pyridoxal phosphate-dependent decarboxylase family protein n=1 Tax=Gracilimonas aurantiaca TaxID=3234185 RepID=UPI003465EEAD
MDQKYSTYLEEILSGINNWKNSFGEWEQDPTLSVSENEIRKVFSEFVQRLEGNYPFHHPSYAGQMLKPPHAVAWMAYSLAMTINPNNHALDGGPPTSEMEKEVMQLLSDYVGYGSEFLGHLTASGTIANLEALWVARNCHPGKKIAYSANAHYTHERMCGVIGVEGCKIPVDPEGSFQLDQVDPKGIGTVVVTLGTTGLGDIEPLSEIMPWAKINGIRIHIDAAYGGFFKTIAGSDLLNSKNWDLMPEADSIVIDPHKHGLQPYGCGAVIFKDPGVGKYYQHDSPYTYFTSEELHLGEISLECSRAGAAAAAFWTTLQLFPLKAEKGFGPVMKKCRAAALKAYDLLSNSKKLDAYKEPDLDIIAYFPLPEEKKLTEVSRLSKAVFEKGMKDKTFYLSLYKIPAEDFIRRHPAYESDEELVTVLRSVLMKPEQADYVNELFTLIEAAVE